MAEGLNRVTLIGNLGADPELRFTQGGQAVLHMRMACTESYLDKDKVRQQRTEWVNTTVWGKRGESLAKILRKGSQIYVEGALRTTSYDNRDGAKVYKTEVVCNNILLLGGNRDGGSSAPDHSEAPPARGNSAQRGGGSASRGAPAAPAESTGDDYDGGGYGGASGEDIPF